MSFTEDSSDVEWKHGNTKKEKGSKQDQSSPHSKQKYSQKFCEKWLSIFNPWLTRCDDDVNKPFCRACQCRLDCNRCHLQRHERTTKHARNLDILISKGEGAARQNLSIRQERSKYYQQRKKGHSSVASSHDASEIGMDTTDDFMDDADPDSEQAFQFVPAENSTVEQYKEENAMKQENVSIDGNDPLPVVITSRRGNARSPKKNVKKERMKLLMQIQKDKNDLMESFKELMGGPYQQSPPKDRNHVDLFFDSVSSSVKAFSPKLIAEMKMRTSQLICEMELRALTENDSAGGTALVVTSEAGTVNGASYIINHPNVVHQELDSADYQVLS